MDPLCGANPGRSVCGMRPLLRYRCTQSAQRGYRLRDPWDQSERAKATSPDAPAQSGQGCRVKVRPPRPLRGYVSKAISEGKRVFLTATVEGDTFIGLDSLATAAGVSRGRILDRLVKSALEANLGPVNDHCSEPLTLASHRCDAER